MAGDAADLLFIDAPYNVDYEGYTEDRLKMQGDRMSAVAYLALRGPASKEAEVGLPAEKCLG